MRIVIQRVKSSSVQIDGKIHASIQEGLMILLGIEQTDGKEDADWLVSKILQLRIFNDDNGVMNLSIKDIEGEILLVSQFTLHASTKKGNRPSYIKAAKPDISIPLYEYCIEQLKKEIGNRLKTGIFGADMKVHLINDGPVTILIDSKIKE
jgi:D-aminoacyl-tRNA deacylase